MKKDGRPGPPIHLPEIAGAMLEAEPKLKLRYTSGKCTKCAPKVSRISEVGVAASSCLEGRKIENVEGIEEVDSYLQIRRFTQMKEAWQSCLFDQTQIYGPVVWPTERVAADAGGPSY